MKILIFLVNSKSVQTSIHIYAYIIVKTILKLKHYANTYLFTNINTGVYLTKTMLHFQITDPVHKKDWRVFRNVIA